MLAHDLFYRLHARFFNMNRVLHTRTYLKVLKLFLCARVHLVSIYNIFVTIFMCQRSKQNQP